MPFAKVNVVLSSAAFVLYVVGVSAPYWMSASFQMPVPPPDGLPVEDHMGLFVNCKDLHFKRRTDSTCDTEGALDWQFLAAGMAVLGVVLGLVSTVMNWVHGCVRRCMESHKLVVITALLSIAAAGFMTSTLILYAMNHRFKVDPNLHYTHIFDFDWAYFLSAAGACLYALLGLTNFLDGIGLAEKVVMLDAELSLNNDRSSFRKSTITPLSSIRG